MEKILPVNIEYGGGGGTHEHKARSSDFYLKAATSLTTGNINTFHRLTEARFEISIAYCFDSMVALQDASEHMMNMSK